MTIARPQEVGGGYDTGEIRGAAFATPNEDVGEGDKQGTPLWLFKLLRDEFWFPGGDLFADHGNALLPTYWTLESPIDVDAYRDLGYTFFANPPYSRGNITAAANTCRALADNGNRVVGLTRAEPTARWWRILRPACAEVRLLDTRLVFRGQEGLYNFPCWVWVAVPPTQRRGHPSVWFWDAAEMYEQRYGSKP